jgi:hypothetical protein
MIEPEIEITEQDFHLRVVASLARLEIMAKSTDDHLQRLNGTVDRHEERLQALREDVGRHQLQCPVRADVELLKTATLTEKVTSQVTSAWWQRISPLLWLAVGGVIVLFLIHADELLQHFAKP